MTKENARRGIVKAYYNKDFLYSPNARAIRLLAEYFEPQARLRKHKIRGTIVMFGSARAVPPEELETEIIASRSKLETADGAAARAIQKRLDIIEQLSRYYIEAQQLAFLLTQYYKNHEDQKQRHVICSGGGPGIMEAANRGAAEAGGKTVGFGISLPFEQGINSYIEPDQAFEFHYFFMRKFWFIYLAKALVVFPGGFGTLDELFETLTLVQTGKVKKKLPVVLYGARYWEDVVRFDKMVDWGVIAPDDVGLFRICNTPEEALEYLKTEINSAYPMEPGEGSLE